MSEDSNQHALNLEDTLIGHINIQNAVNLSLVKFLVQKGIIDLGEFQEFMKDQEFLIRKQLNPEVTEVFSKQLSEAFQYAALNLADED
ncbi:hypothetical protein [Acinetobacter baumannii]|uniref:hypothetical protein n=1 Tax=Acinetobacter baumannii TaxID=470 RepID=UPI00389238FC